MLLSTMRRPLTALVAAAMLATFSAQAFAQGAVSVQLNGNTLNLNPAPTERAGRVFVPLRGVFENMGASVVYANGTINASGRGHNVSLHIGSTQATVDGQNQTLDVAPFIIGASTYVPLRFVSQALGATVNWDNSNRVVAISTNGNAPPPQSNSALRLANVNPGRNATVQGRRPEITATFSGANAEPNSLRVSLDGLDITGQTSRSPSGIDYQPPSPLQSGRHTVRITGRDANNVAFERGWSFTSGESNVSANLEVSTPQNDATVGNTFQVSGHTTPGAHVVVQAGVTAVNITNVIGALLGAGGTSGNSSQNDVTADGNGYFSTQVSLGAPSGSRIGLVVSSTDPRTGASATPVRRTLIVQ